MGILLTLGTLVFCATGFTIGFINQRIAEIEKKRHFSTHRLGVVATGLFMIGLVLDWSDFYLTGAALAMMWFCINAIAIVWLVTDIKYLNPHSVRSLDDQGM